MTDSNYQKAEYWDNRYKSRPQPFDWLQTLPDLQALLFKYINKKDNILHIGCGNSKLPETLSDAGYKNITNIDFSKKVIEQISKRYQNRYPKMKFKVMNILDMNEFRENSFDIIIDKNALDCILCGGKSKEKYEKSLSEIYRVLSPEGKFIMISYNTPLYIKKFLNEYDWYIEIFTVDKTIKGKISNYDSFSLLKNVHYIYIMTSQKKVLQYSLNLSNNKSIITKNSEKNFQTNSNLKKETNKNIINIENNNKKKEDNNNKIQKINKKENNIENKNENDKDKKEKDKTIYIKVNNNIIKNDITEKDQKINNILKNSSSLTQNQNINDNEMKSNLLVNENQLSKLKENNLEKNREIKPELEKKIEKCEDNNINNNENIKEKNLNRINLDNLLIENYSKGNNNNLTDEITRIKNNIQKDIKNVNYIKSNEKKCCKNCIIF